MYVVEVTLGTNDDYLIHSYDLPREVNEFNA